MGSRYKLILKQNITFAVCGIMPHITAQIIQLKPDTSTTVWKELLTHLHSSFFMSPCYFIPII